MAKRKIVLARYGDPIRYDRPAAEAVAPGQIVELTSADKFQKHSTAGGNVLPLIVAVEDDLQGKTVTDDYSADNRLQAEVLRPGDRVLLQLKDGESVSIGDPLESAGDGDVQPHTPDTETLGADSSGALTTIYGKQIVAIAEEALDLSSSSGAESTRLLKCIAV
jgi:hypothetical protein